MYTVWGSVPFIVAAAQGAKRIVERYPSFLGQAGTDAPDATEQKHGIDQRDPLFARQCCFRRLRRFPRFRRRAAVFFHTLQALTAAALTTVLPVLVLILVVVVSWSRLSAVPTLPLPLPRRCPMRLQHAQTFGQYLTTFQFIRHQIDQGGNGP